MKTILKTAVFLFVTTAFVSSCKKDDQPAVNQDINVIKGAVKVDTNQIAPLSPKIIFETSENVKPSIKILGKNTSSGDLSHEFSTFGKNHELLILGLYPDHNNAVELSLFNHQDELLFVDTVSIQTPVPPGGLPQIDIITAQPSAMEPGLTFVSYRNHDNPNIPFVMDEEGEIRWYLDYGTHPDLHNLFYDCGMERLANGNLYFGSSKTDKIYEVDMQGSVLREWDLPDYEFHHNVQEMPNGNFLATVNKPGSMHSSGVPTEEDYVIEIDRNSGNIVTEWDLKESLDENRGTMADLSADPVDWFHGNAVIYDPSDQCIIVSGRTQALVKLDKHNQVKWILGPHLDWDKDAYGNDLTQKLLQPLDASGAPITDNNILDGNQLHPDFDWNWYQHAPLITPGGNIMLFDNGDNRHWGASPSYSRAVEFDIDENNMTVQQKWEYGKSRGVECYSRLVSDVDYLTGKNNVLFNSGWLTNSSSGNPEGRVVEIDYSSRNVVFEAKIISPDQARSITFHRAERLGLYP